MQTNEEVMKEVLATMRETLIERGAVYGDVKVNLRRTADMVNVFLGGHKDPTNLSETDTAILQILFKVSRIIETGDHQDSFLDIGGYALASVGILKRKEQEINENV